MTPAIASTCQDPVAVLASMTPGQFRRAMAAHAGANPAQLATLTALEQYVDTHCPAYDARPDGSVHATYTYLPGRTINAVVHPDGTFQDQP